jgi:hypothetical protein
MKDKEPSLASNHQNLALMIEGEEDNTMMTLPLRRAGFDEDKEYQKFIKNIERMVRSSAEYREWSTFVKDTLGYSTCAITEEKSAEVTIEIHHHPINLYTICKAIITSYINKEKQFCSVDIALECLELHYKNQVGYIPLVSSIHEKFHNGFLKIPIDFVHGEWKHVLNNYPMEDVDVQMISDMSMVQLDQLKQDWSRNNYDAISNG